MKKNKLQFRYIILLVLAVIGVGYTIFGTSISGRKDNITVDENAVIVKGTYSIDIQLTAITDLNLKDAHPKTSWRTNGMSLLGMKFGYFKLADGEKCFLYLRNRETPVIHIERKNDIPVFINCNSPDETIALYKKIEDSLTKVIK